MCKASDIYDKRMAWIEYSLGILSFLLTVPAIWAAFEILHYSPAPHTEGLEFLLLHVQFLTFSSWAGVFGILAVANPDSRVKVHFSWLKKFLSKNAFSLLGLVTNLASWGLVIYSNVTEF